MIDVTFLINRGDEADMASITPPANDGEPVFTLDTHRFFVSEGGVWHEIGGDVTGTPGDFTVGDDLTVVDDAAVGGDLAVVGSINGASLTVTGGVIGQDFSGLNASFTGDVTVGDDLSVGGTVDMNTGTWKLRRGLLAAIPALADGEAWWSTDAHTLHVGQGGVNYAVGATLADGVYGDLTVSGGGTVISVNGDSVAAADLSATQPCLFGRADAVAGPTDPGQEIVLGDGFAFDTSTPGAPVLNLTAAYLGNAGLHIRDNNDTDWLIVAVGSNLTATRTLTLIPGDADRSLTFTSNATIGGTHSGTNTGDVTLSGENYLSIAGQVIAVAAVNLSGTHVTGTLAAGRFPALTGDVTTSAGSLATTVANNAVTLAKMADLATDRLIGRDTAGTGDPEALTVGGGLEFTGSGGIQRSALTGDVTASAGSNATTLATVTVAKGGTGATTAAAARATLGVDSLLGLNLLLNSDFRFAQRQARATFTGWATGSYTMDRWFLQHDTGASDVQTRTVRVGTDSLVGGSPPDGQSAYGAVKNNSGAAAGVLLCQALEAAGPCGLSAYALRGGAVAVTFRVYALVSTGTPSLKLRAWSWTGSGNAAGARNLVASWSSNVPTFNTTTLTAVAAATSTALNASTWTLCEFTGTVPSSVNNLTVALWVEGLASGTTLYLTGSGLWAGTPPDVWRPHPADEALCYRYGESPFADAVGTAPADGNGDWRSAGAALDTANVYAARVLYRTRKRTTPTLTFTRASVGATAGQWSAYTGGAWADVTTTQSVAATDTGFTPHLQKTALFTANSAYSVIGGWFADAEI